ncbi:MAG: hypothetical protein Ct9H90mP2_15000 [Dehalococcoidia bacterium]|nr:MAG: hypothetical protein Ct9H90mP2_15000 [Dehalococcoidia bacterium]
MGRENNKEFCWFVDPIDGQLHFQKGFHYLEPLWFTKKENPIMGFIELPKFNQRFFSCQEKDVTKIIL